MPALQTFAKNANETGVKRTEHKQARVTLTRTIEPANRGLKILLAALCVLVLVTTLSAGLWPFSFHAENTVTWNPDRAGLFFGDHGMVISKGPFSGTATDGAGGCSMEILLNPARASDAGTILSFYNPQASSWIQLRQSIDDLAFTRSLGPAYNHKNQRSMFVDHALQKGQWILVTLTSSGGVLSVYLNGVIRETAKNVDLRPGDFAGTLIVGTSPYGNSSWSGTVRGLALYDHALRSGEIARDYRAWQKNKDGLALSEATPFSLYRFDEGGGTILHNLGKSGSDLEIPADYFIMQPGFLVPFWREYHANWEYLQDLAINVFGLLPLGFCFSALFAWRMGVRRCLLFTTILGFCVSLTIEILQGYMAIRISGTTDLITNTSGTALGAWLYLNADVQGWFKRLGLVRTA